jgi:hypothetical protein
MKPTSFQVFLEGTALYLACLVLPSVLGYLYQTRGLYLYQLRSMICDHIGWYCPPKPAPAMSVVSPDASQNDLWVVAIGALILASFRILIVRSLVPDLDKKGSLEAMVRSKSSHLLSSEYTKVSSSQREINDLNVAPRFATAVFRLGFSFLACTLAWFSFHGSNFWPWYVGGHGTTANCWDLSGGLSLAMDGDFDHANFALKRYFLFQASYHWHSGGFHVLSLVMLVWRKASLSKQTGNYARSLIHHLLAIVLITSAYIFSSLRRLLVIGMFAFDASSCFLHALQICMNHNRLKVHTRKVYWVVVPSFIVARFFIWSCLYYSVVYESQEWLRQLEHSLLPGSAKAVGWVLFALYALLMAVNVVYLRRLLRQERWQVS